MVTRALRIAAVASILFTASVLTGGPALADENEAVLRCSVDEVKPTVGSQVHLACSLIDNLSVPLSDTDVTFYVRTENRADASWENGRKVSIVKTDARGQVKATLDAGPKVGNLGILVNYPGIYSYYTFIEVAPAPVALPPAPPPPVYVAPVYDPALDYTTPDADVGGNT